MGESSIVDVTKDILGTDIDNVLKNSMSIEDLNSAVKKADIEYAPTNIVNSKGALLDSSNDPDKPSQDDVDPIKSTLTELLDIYSDKLGVHVSYDGLNESIRVAIASSKSAREITKAIQSDLAATMSDVLIFKSIIVIGKVIDSQLDGIMNSDFTGSLSGETVSILSQMFGWIEKLEAIKTKYAQFDVFQKVRDLSNSKSDVTKRNELELHLIDVLRHGVDSMVKS